MIIGITGSFGSGKTTVANMFGRYGFRVINADKLYRNIYRKNRLLKNKIKQEFGTTDRNKIKKIVFTNPAKLRKLNKITHPIIIKEIKKEINTIMKKYNKKILIKNKKFNNKKNKINIENKIKGINGVKIIIDVPLLFEAKIQNMFDKIIVVKCSKKEQMRRLLKNKKYSKAEIDNIIKSQMPLKEKIKKADFVVDNNRSIAEAKAQVSSILHYMQKP